MASYKDWLEIENPNSLDMETLKKAIRSMGNAANKRLKRMQEKDIFYGSETGSETTSGVRRFTVRNKSLEELKREFKRVRNFLNNPQSSLTGMFQTLKKFKEEVVKGRNRYARRDDAFSEAQAKDYRKMQKQKATSALPTERRFSRYDELRQWRKVWDYYNQLVEEGKYAPSEYDSTQVRNQVMQITADQMIGNMSDEETYQRIVEAITGEYEQRTETENNQTQDMSTSRFFELGSSD